MTIQTAASTIVNILTQGKGKMEWAEYRSLKSELERQPSALAASFTDEELDQVVSDLPAELLEAVQQAAMSGNSQCTCGDLHLNTQSKSTTLLAHVLSTPVGLFLTEWAQRTYSKGETIADVTLSWEALDGLAPTFLEVMQTHDLWQAEGEDIGDETLGKLIGAIAQDLPDACKILRKVALEFEPSTPQLSSLMPNPPAKDAIVLGKSTRVSTQAEPPSDEAQQQLEVIISSPLEYYIAHYLQRQGRSIEYITMTTAEMLLMSREVEPLMALGVKPKVMQG